MSIKQELQDIATYIEDVLLKENIILHRYDAYSTNSIYLKLDYGVANSIRISDHNGKRHLSYRFNILLNLTKTETTTRNNFPMYFYPVTDIDKLINHILEQRLTKQLRYGEQKYTTFMQKNKQTIMKETPKGFWCHAKLVKKKEVTI